MAETLELRIVTPEREVLEETVESVTAEGALGQFGVLPKHIAFVTPLEPGPLTYTKGGAARRLAVKGGYAEVRDDVMTVLADEAIPAERIDVRGARADLEQADARLEATAYGDPEHERWLMERKWAEVRLALAAS
ncbi:MAG: F-type H+-transporting ATPase subunit epsilon [Candidatus Binatota bacterium]|jgi:F-type H+-transporting ATPase subunit epsilon|nr:F-type H+-transporting ATPase subunit epsilon [Candidatus Binatota bacterium]